MSGLLVAIMATLKIAVDNLDIPYGDRFEADNAEIDRLYSAKSVFVIAKRYLIKAFRILSTKGNSKVGKMATFSILPGAGKYLYKGIEIFGSCAQEICKLCYGFCYAVRMMIRRGGAEQGNNNPDAVSQVRGTVSIGWFKRTLALAVSPVAVMHDIILQVQKQHVKLVRIDVSGELSLHTYKMWCVVANSCPDCHFYVYTKDVKTLTFLAFNNDSYIPGNLVVNVSIWHEQNIYLYKVLKKKYGKQVKAFVCMDGFDYDSFGLHIKSMCPAYDENGKTAFRDKKKKTHYTCDECGKCIYADRAQENGCSLH